MPQVNYLVIILLSFLLILSIAVLLMKNIFHIIITFGAYSIIMSLVWQQFNAPDIAITEAAVGAGSTILMVAVYSHIRRRRSKHDKKN